MWRRRTRLRGRFCRVMTCRYGDIVAGVGIFMMLPG